MLTSAQHRLFWLAPAALLFPLALAIAQAPAEPYSVINRDAVNYAGPGREPARDLTGPELKIGLLAPLAGPREAEGQALIQAAQLALEDEAASPMAGGRRLILVNRDESGPWGRASSEIVRLIFDDQVVALITGMEGGTAHLAEQLGNKIGVPIVTLATDKTTTEINLPWIFRLGPDDSTQALALAGSVYRGRGTKRVLLVSEDNHDGRVGREEFEKAARKLQALAPLRLVVASDLLHPEEVARAIAVQRPEAIVLWTGPETATALLAQLRERLPSAPVFLCRKAAQGRFKNLTPDCAICSGSPKAASGGLSGPPLASPSSKQEDGGIWMAAADPAPQAARESFERRYRERLGISPSLAATQAYDAVRVLAAALRQSGPNRARLRDRLAGTSAFPGVSGIISFDHAGNNGTPITAVRLEYSQD